MTKKTHSINCRIDNSPEDNTAFAPGGVTPSYRGGLCKLGALFFNSGAEKVEVVTGEATKSEMVIVGKRLYTTRKWIAKDIK